MFYHLLQRRDVYERLTQELDEAFPSGEIQVEDISSFSKLPYLTAVVNEGLRLSTPFPGIPRVVPKGGIAIKDRFIPEGTVVSIPAWPQHVNPENFFPAPLDFMPERWLPGGLGPGSVLQPAALMVFSSGMCARLAGSMYFQSLQSHRRLWLHWKAAGNAADQCRNRAPTSLF